METRLRSSGSGRARLVDGVSWVDGTGRIRGRGRGTTGLLVLTLLPYRQIYRPDLLLTLT